MKALSVKQPFADSKCKGDKNIEFRSRPISYRGELLICSSKSARGNFKEVNGVLMPLPIGVALCIVRVIECRPMATKDKKVFGAPLFIDGCWSWIFDKNYCEAVKPVLVKGSVSFFNVEDKIIKTIPKGKHWWNYDYPNKGELPSK